MYKYRIVLNGSEIKSDDLRIFSRGLNRQVIKWLEAGNKELLDKIKSVSQQRPFNISFLKKSDNGKYDFILTFIEDAPLLKDAFLTGVEKSSSKVDLNYKEFTLIGYEEIKKESITELLEKASSLQGYSRIKMDFVSETAFIRRGLNNEESIGEFPFPDPAKIFDSLVKRWNRFTDKEFAIEEAEVMNAVNNHLKILSAEISAETFCLGFADKKEMLMTGFRGNIVFEIHTRDLKVKKLLATLSLYSEWSGVGKKTAFGMGETRTVIS